VRTVSGSGQDPRIGRITAAPLCQRAGAALRHPSSWDIPIRKEES
jgi:hypothetical protein